MIFTIWYHTTQKQPDSNGYYVTCDYNMSYDSRYYYDGNWFNSQFSSTTEDVEYWCEPIVQMMDDYRPLNPAELISAEAVIKAIENFDLIRNLST
jgi:hypothetical protein